MKNYNYYEVVKEDLKDNVRNDSNIDIYDLEHRSDAIYDDAFINDSITGYASGSYFCNTYKARECVIDNIDLLEEVKNEYSIDMNEHFSDWEYLDVSIRCYVLGQVFNEAIKELIEEYEESEINK